MMSKQATFYLISAFLPTTTSNPVAEPNSEDTSWAKIEELACDLASKYWREGKKILLWCENQTQAEKVDEALWTRKPEEFVPHNLAGEATSSPTPVEIGWLGNRNNQRRDILINLTATIPEFITSFNQVIDFVPTNEELKQLARQRYKQYRELGFQLTLQEN